MKKSLLALAAMTAVAGSAMAQSSVTLFGVIDVAGTYVDNDGGGSKYLMTTDGNASSRFGVRGVEDLGGGLRAGFWLEGSLAADEGIVSSKFWGRRSTVSLMGGWGEVRLGRDYTPTFWNWTVFDPFGTNGVGAATNLALEIAGSILGGNYATLVRADNTIGYHLPAGLGGFYGQAMVAAGEGVVGNKYYGGRIGWASGPFDVAAAYGQTEGPTLGNMDISNWNIAGAWNLGFAKITGFYGNLEVDGRGSQDNWYVGASVPMGAWTFKGTYGAVDRSVDSGSFVDGGASQWALGFTYDLSKRTAFYGTFSSISNDSGMAFKVFGGPNAPSVSGGGDSTGYQFGVRHSF